MRYWLLRLLGRADGPVRRCPSCGGHFDKAAGVPTDYLEDACSAECAEEHNRAMAL